MITAFLLKRQSSTKQRLGTTYQVMTLSATGDADTPAGGSVCMRWVFCQSQEMIVCSELVPPRTLKSRIKRRRAGVDMIAD
jgi:hypothetical protein